MLIGQLLVGPTSTTVYGGAGGGLLVLKSLTRRHKGGVLWVSAVINNHNKRQQNHYSILGVSTSASSSDIKRAYRLLARKWHPDVSKDSRAGEVFQNIHLAYQVLSNEATRNQYDRVLKSADYASEPIRRNTSDAFEYEDEIKMRKWDELKQKMRNDRYQSYYGRYNIESDEESEDNEEEERGSFFEVLLSAFFSIFLMQAVSCQLSLMFSSLMAWFDGKLDAGYKLGYLVAWVLGGRGGVMLSLCLTFASWVCGKTSSSIVSLVIVAMWVGSNVLSYVPCPPGALLALLYMSIKLQTDVI